MVIILSKTLSKVSLTDWLVILNDSWILRGLYHFLISSVTFTNVIYSFYFCRLSFLTVRDLVRDDSLTRGRTPTTHVTPVTIVDDSNQHQVNIKHSTFNTHSLFSISVRSKNPCSTRFRDLPLIRPSPLLSSPYFSPIPIETLYLWLIRELPHLLNGSIHDHHRSIEIWGKSPQI